MHQAATPTKDDNATDDGQPRVPQVGGKAFDETLLRQIVESSTDCIKVLDLDGNLIAMNEGGRCLLGIKDLSPLLGGCWTDWWKGLDRAEAEAAVQVAREGGVGRFEAFAETFAGVGKWWDVVVSPIPGPDPDIPPHRLLCVSRDITEKKRVEARYADARGRLESALTSGEVATFDYDIAADRVYADRNLARLFGVGEAEAQGGAIAAYLRAIHPDDLPNVERSLAASFESGDNYEVEHRMVAAGGAERWVSARGRIERDEAGRAVRLVGAVMDVSDRRRAEQAAIHGREQIEMVVRAANVGVWFCPLPFDVLHWDERVKAHFHLPPDAAVTIDTFYQRLHPDDRERTRTAIDAAIAAREVYDVDYRTVSPDGREVKHVRAIGRAVYDAAGNATRFDGVTIDATDRRRAEERNRLLVALDDATRPLTDPHEITQTCARLLGDHLGADRCAYGEVGEDQDALEVAGDYNRPGVASMVGRYSLGRDFGAEVLRRMRADEAYVVSDIETHDPPPERIDAYRAVGVRSTISVPLHKAGRLVAAMAVHQRVPRRWTGEEVDLVRAAASRCWESIERARVARELRESEARFRTLADAMPQNVWTASADGTLEYYNRRWYDYTGQPAHLTGDESWVEAVHPDDLAAIGERWYAAVRAGEPFTMEFRLKRHDGAFRWFLCRAEPVRDAEGRTVRYYGTSTDIDDQKRIEQALRESESRYRGLFESIDQGFCILEMIYDAAGRVENYRFVEVNPVFERQTGMAGAVGRTIRDFAPNIEQHWCDLYGDVVRTGEPAKFENVAEDLGRWFEIYAFRLGGEGSGRVAVLFKDVTEAKRAERVLRDSEERYRLATRATNDAIWDWDLATNEVRWNEAVRDLFGYGEGDVAPTADWWTEHIHPEDRDRVAHSIHETIDDPSSDHWSDEYRFRRADGGYADVFDRGYVLRDAAGRGVRMIGAMQDLTERKRAEQRREELLKIEQDARAEAERASKIKDEFLATLGHELRTPLNAIMGWSQLLGSGTPSEEDVREGVEVIERNARAQTQIVEDLLDMSRIISGKVRLDVQPVDLEKVVRAAIETVRPAAEAKNVRVLAVLDPMAAPVSGDPNRLQQVFWNLLSNAVKFTPKGGRVQAVLKRVNSHLEVDVIDSGEGIDGEFLPFVFDRFRQADASSTRGHGGLGLGLSIVKQLVELHGGSVRVKSGGRGQGATFTVALPLTVLHPEPPDVEPVRRHPKGDHDGMGIDPDACSQVKGLRVLVVDDEADARKLIGRLLKECDARTTTAGSAEEAVTLLREAAQDGRGFDVMVSDIGMPGEDGYALIRRVRQMPAEEGGDVPATALTAYARSEDRLRVLRAGYQMHLSKPVEPAELIAVVASLARRRR